MRPLSEIEREVADAKSCGDMKRVQDIADELLARLKESEDAAIQAGESDAG